MKGAKGPRNVRWNGGTSEYKDHYLLKLNRIEALKRSGGKCEKCGKPAVNVHHIDCSKENHDLDNLMPLCKRCHTRMHRPSRNKTSKYIRKYGISLYDIAEKCGISYNVAYNRMRLPDSSQKKAELIKIIQDANVFT